MFEIFSLAPMEILGIDIGGSGIKGAPVNIKTGELTQERHRIETPKDATPHEIAEIINELVSHFNWTGRVGCGFPSVVQNGEAITYGNLSKEWKGVQINKLFEQHTNLPFTVINDADAAGLGEVHFGAAKGRNGLIVMVTAGTGIGSGLFLDGKLIPNTEMGRMLYKDGEVVEKFAADSARKREGLSYEEWGTRFNKFLKMVRKLCYPDLIIIGGGSSKKIDKFEHTLTVKTPWVVAQNLNNAGIIGAAVAAAP